MWKITNKETPDTITSLFSIRTRAYGDNNCKYNLQSINRSNEEKYNISRAVSLEHNSFRN